MRYLSRILYGFAIFIICVTAALLLQIDSSAMSMADALFPGSGRVVCLILLASEAAGACWLYLSFRLRPAKLVIRHNPDDDERLAFAEELEKRLARNQIVREAGLVPSDEEFAEKAMLLLDKKADDEIRSAGKRIFLGTALAQNGKLDALIVFFSLVRLVWRVSSIYNQRPAPREIMSVYGAVSSATFVAFSLDALDIPRTITDSVSQIVPSAAPAMTAASVPFMGSALHVFTAAAIDGASNCLLAVRAAAWHCAGEVPSRRARGCGGAQRVPLRRLGRRKPACEHEGDGRPAHGHYPGNHGSHCEGRETADALRLCRHGQKDGHRGRHHGRSSGRSHGKRGRRRYPCGRGTRRWNARRARVKAGRGKGHGREAFLSGRRRRKEKILLRQAERKIIGPGRQAGYLGLPALAAPACPL